MSRTLKTTLCILLPLLVVLPFVLVRLSGRSRPAAPRGAHLSGTLAPGDLLADILEENGVPPVRGHAMLSSLAGHLDARRCGVGDGWELHLGESPGEIRFVYHRGPLETFEAVSAPDTDVCRVHVVRRRADRRQYGAAGEVAGSLWESMSAAGVGPEMIVQFAEAFASRIDFFTDCRPGDRYAVVWESSVLEGRVLADTRVLAAVYRNGAAAHRAFLHRTVDGRDAYYDDRGTALERAFMKAPLDYRRISSYFSRARFHPIKRTYRPHLGIDYAAPHGTPVSAVGDGTVLSAGWTRDGYGIAVRIRHPNGYVSYYGHLSRIASGVRPGRKVRKGQVVAAVGSTGCSTGPHLDFRLSRNGSFINFLTLETPPAAPVPAAEMSVFGAVRDDLSAKLERLPASRAGGRAVCLAP